GRVSAGARVVGPGSRPRLSQLAGRCFGSIGFPQYSDEVRSENEQKPALLEVAAALREVHRALVTATRAAYEREVGPAGGPGHLLRLLTEDPFFAWLHPMSELIVDLDALLAQELLPPGTVAGVRVEVDRLVQAGGSPFWEKYAPFLQSEPEVTMAH